MSNNDHIGTGVDRRTLLRAGLLTTAGLAGAGIFGAAGARAGVPPESSGPLPASLRFDLTPKTVPKALFPVNRTLHSRTGPMQSMAFDNVNKQLFVVQAQDHTNKQNLIVNHVSLTDGHVYSSMQLNGAGHGVTFGVEPVGKSSYIWLECDAHTKGEDARGTALARFKYEANTKPSVTKHFVGSTAITCATDNVHKRVAVRRIVNGKYTYGVYDLANGKFGYHYVQRNEPSYLLNGVKQTFQGYALYGQYLYVLTGEANADANHYSTIWCLDLNVPGATAHIKEHSTTHAYKSLVGREPEGIAYFIPRGGHTGLYFGFVSHPRAKKDPDRFASIIGKTGWA